MMQTITEISRELVSVEDAASAARAGHFLFLREASSHGILCLPAQFVTAERLTLLMRTLPGKLSVALPVARLDALHLPVRSSKTTYPLFLLYEAEQIPAYAATIHALVNPLTRPEDVHIPTGLSLHAVAHSGTLQQRGYAEAAIDLLRMAGLEPGAVLYEPIYPSDEGEAILTSLIDYLQATPVSLDDIAAYRQCHTVSLITQTQLPTTRATFRLLHFQELETGLPYLAFVLGDLQENPDQAPLLRLHSACATGDIFGSQRCDCQAQLHAALDQIAREGRGVLLYLPQEGRGIGLSAKLQAYVLQEQGYDTLEANVHLGYPADARSYETAIEIVQKLGLKSVHLLTNNPEKATALVDAGIAVERVPLEMAPSASNLAYLQTKFQRFGHLFSALPEMNGHV